MMTALRCLALSIMLLAATHAARAAEDITISHVGTDGSPQHIVATAFAAEVERLMPGRFRIDVKGGTMMGSEVDIWQAGKLGAVDVVIVSAPSIAPLVSCLGVLNVPFLFRDLDHVARVLDGDIGKELGAALSSEGMVFLAFAQRGFNHVTNSKRVIERPSDFKGLRIRVIPNPVYEAVFRSLGAQVVPMAWPGVYGALDDGRIDGQDNPLLALSGQMFFRVQRFLSLTGFTMGPLVMAINAETYQHLTPLERDVFAEAGRAGAAASLRVIITGESDIVAEFRRNGVFVNEAIDRQAFRAALADLEPVWEGSFGADLIRRIRNVR